MKDRLLRVNQVLEIVPVGKSTWWKKVRSGDFPQPIKLGERTTCWKESEVLALVERGL